MSFHEPPIPANYIILKETIDTTDYYYAINGKTGETEFGGLGNVGGIAGTNSSAVIQSALNALTSNRDWLETVILMGEIELNDIIAIKAYTQFLISGKLILKSGFPTTIGLAVRGGNVILGGGGIFDGNRANQTLDVRGIEIEPIAGDPVFNNVIVHNLILQNHITEALYFYEVEHCLVSNILGYNNDTHIDIGGKANDISICQCALNAGGYAIIVSTDAQEGRNFNINNVTAKNITYGMRLAATTFTLRRVVMKSVHVHGGSIGLNMEGYIEDCRILNSHFNDNLYGLYVMSADVKNNYFAYNDFSGNSTKNVYFFAGSPKLNYWRQNKGFVTEGSGTATISAGQMSVTVPHELDVTPSLEKIKLIPQDNLAGRSIWVSDATSTSFKINISSEDIVDHVIGWSYNE